MVYDTATHRSPDIPAPHQFAPQKYNILPTNKNATPFISPFNTLILIDNIIKEVPEAKIITTDTSYHDSLLKPWVINNPLYNRDEWQ